MDPKRAQQVNCNILISVGAIRHAWPTASPGIRVSLLTKHGKTGRTGTLARDGTGANKHMYKLDEDGSLGPTTSRNDLIRLVKPESNKHLDRHVLYAAL